MAGLVGGSEENYSGPGGFGGGANMPGRRPPAGRRRPPYIPGFDPGSRGNEPDIFSGRGGAASAPGMGGGFGGSDRASGFGGGAGQNAGGFGQAGSNQGSTGFGGGGWSDFSPTLGSGLGGGGATTPNNPPSVNQPPMMNTPTGGMPPQGGPPAGFGGTGVRYPSAGSDAARQKTYQSNTGGMNTPGSPQTPPVTGSYQFNNAGTGTGGGQTVPGWGNTIKRQGPTYNYGGNTSTFNMTQQGDTLNQDQSMKRLQNQRRAKAAKAPRQQDRRGSTVQQNLNAMSGGMRYM